MPRKGGSIMQATDYDARTEAWLKRHGLRFSIPHARNPRSPGWDGPHGNHYRPRFSRIGEPGSLTFDFWGSMNDMHEGKDPTAYAVLSCVASDVHCPLTFADFCAEYGYDEDSRKAFATFKRCAAFAERLRRFFTDEEIEDMATIDGED
jgi:hypothetical protein